MNDSANLLLVTLSVLIIYSNCQCSCSRRGRVRAEDDGQEGDGQRQIECKRDCPKVYRPVCGTDGNTYRNYCYLKQEMCKGKPVKFDHLGDCGKVVCDDLCILLDDPVCGTDGKTYVNECGLNQAMVCEGVDVVLAYEGQCKADEPPRKCDPYCPKILLPVCGTDGVTYANMCSLEYKICIGKKVALAYKGQCKRPGFGPKSIEEEKEEEQDYH